MKLAEASTGLTIPALNQSLSKLPALTARAWVGAENGSPDGPSDTKAKYMSQIQAKQDPAISSRDNSRNVTSRRQSRTLQVRIEQVIGNVKRGYSENTATRLSNQDPNISRKPDCLVPGRNGPGLWPGAWGPGQWDQGNGTRAMGPGQWGVAGGSRGKD
jgi:hypothetical protein